MQRIMGIIRIFENISLKKVDIRLSKHELADLNSLIENRDKVTMASNPFYFLKYQNAGFLKRRNGLSKTDKNASKITERDKEDYININYARRLTDRKTFTEIVDFISKSR